MKRIIAVALLTLLTACKEAPSPYTPEPFTFETNMSKPIGINVAEIKIVENYQAPLRTPNVEHQFPVVPEAAIKKWVAKRLVATGTSGVLEVVIDDASVKEVPLKKTQGVKGFFTDDQDARYDARLAVSLRLYSGARAISDASGDVVITRSRSINEKATLNQREEIYHQITRDMIATLDSEATKRLRQYFSPYLR